MVVACPTNGGFQNPQQWELKGYKTRTAKGELDGHREAQPEEHGHQLGGGRTAGGGQDGVASTCGPMHL